MDGRLCSQSGFMLLSVFSLRFIVHPNFDIAEPAPEARQRVAHGETVGIHGPT